MISDVVARCETEWDILNFGSDENSTLFTLNECYTTVYDYPNSPSIPTEFQYAWDIIAGVYSSCPGGYGLGTDRLSALASGVLDWFGPSILSLANGDTYQTAFAGCSISALCRDLMAELATSTDAIDILESITGDDLSLAANRNSLCNDIVDAFTTGSSATLESYSLPNGVDINQYEFFSVPGELLPNLNFAEALTIFGAMYTSQ
ncbi:hypothetical protein BSL78_22993 [Apostichopus japonicus]|uniref:Uncharacterized protein n=1 Tax=Stichopus japonicus TaxID=307972 RepID=A0A2G8JWW2_STIJA|nr:hypothetical protein BSL78_22993 [Apostichopus japonicus]